MFHGDGVLKLPPITFGTSSKSRCCGSRKEGKPNPCSCATPRSHLTFYNPFSSQGGARRERGRGGRKGNQKARSNASSPLRPTWLRAIKLRGDQGNQTPSKERNTRLGVPRAGMQKRLGQLLTPPRGLAGRVLTYIAQTPITRAHKE